MDKIFNPSPFLTKVILKRTLHETIYYSIRTKNIRLKFICKIDRIVSNEMIFCAMQLLHIPMNAIEISRFTHCLGLYRKAGAFSGVNAPYSTKSTQSNFLNCNLSRSLISHFARLFFCYYLYGLGN